MSRFANFLVSILIGIPVAAQPGPRAGRCCGGPQAAAAPIASNPIVEIAGVIGRVQIAPGQGMPYLELKQGSESTRVYLGAMHYLVAENFNPKTGQKLVARGYKSTEGMIAIEVKLPEENKTLKLRDANGRPLWRGGPWRGGRDAR